MTEKIELPKPYREKGWTIDEIAQDDLYTGKQLHDVVRMAVEAERRHWRTLAVRIETELMMKRRLRPNDVSKEEIEVMNWLYVALGRSAENPWWKESSDITSPASTPQPERPHSQGT